MYIVLIMKKEQRPRVEVSRSRHRQTLMNKMQSANQPAGGAITWPALEVTHDLGGGVKVGRFDLLPTRPRLTHDDKTDGDSEEAHCQVERHQEELSLWPPPSGWSRSLYLQYKLLTVWQRLHHDAI